MKQQIKIQEKATPMIKMPVHIQTDALVGSLDFKLNFRQGLLGTANN